MILNEKEVLSSTEKSEKMSSRAIRELVFISILFLFGWLDAWMASLNLSNELKIENKTCLQIKTETISCLEEDDNHKTKQDLRLNMFLFRTLHLSEHLCVVFWYLTRFLFNNLTEVFPTFHLGCIVIFYIHKFMWWKYGVLKFEWSLEDVHIISITFIKFD